MNAPAILVMNANLRRLTIMMSQMYGVMHGALHNQATVINYADVQ